jgi:bifunctional non-homologous end joining protein LigD
VTLDEYHARRAFDRTPEPHGDAPLAPTTSPRFVIQEHHASSLHWDLRLEHDGVAASWALPRGLPREPSTNRLAIRTEDHPLSYLAFAGTIPAGEYGAGRMSIWDHGTATIEKFRDDEVIVALAGERVQGRYVLVRTGAREWLIHRIDAPEMPGRGPMPEGIVPMLAKSSSLPDDDARYAFEIKWDGVRALAYVVGGRARLVSRSGIDMTAAFPELRGLGAALGMTEAVLDGEITAVDAAGVPSFERLQRRLGATADARARRLADEVPATYQVFDLLWLEGHPAMPLPYVDRRRLLDGLELDGPSWTVPSYHVGDGAAMLALTRERGLEGVIAKRLDAPYEPGARSGAWLKVKNARRVVCEVGGFTTGAGDRSGRVGALLLGSRDAAGRLTYVGKAGSGLSERSLDRLAGLLAPLARPTSPFAVGEPPAGATFVDPVLRVEIEFLEWTRSGMLRHPTFKALLEDT